MTPQEISDHKRRWLMASYFLSHTHSDVRGECRDWCKANIAQHQWDLKEFTDVYGDTVRFENLIAFNDFNDWYKRRWT